MPTLRALDPRTPARFDRFLDELVRHGHADAAGLDPELAAIGADLQRWGSGAGRPADRMTVAVQPAPGAWAIPADSPAGRRAPRFAPAAASILLVAAVVGLALLSFGQSADDVGQEAGRELVLLDEGGRMVSLDPETLAETGTRAMTEPATPVAGPALEDPYTDESWEASADGSTLVRIVGRYAFDDAGEEDNAAAVTVFDAATGRSVSQFVAPRWGNFAWLSDDGSLLISEAGAGIHFFTDGHRPPTGVADQRAPSWYVYETGSGRLLATIGDPRDRSPVIWGMAFVDPGGTRLFHLVVPETAVYPGPWPVQLVVNDVRTGRELARLDLPEIVAGEWPSGGTGTVPAECFVDQAGTPEAGPRSEAAWDAVQPGVAFSPDGGTLAIVHADGDRITLIDPAAVRIERTVAILPATATPPAEPILDCGTGAGQVQWPTFTPDGAALIVTSYESAPNATSGAATAVRETVRIDLDSGRVVAQAPPLNASFLPLLDVGTVRADSIYALGLAGDDAATRLIRLDAATLRPVAERSIDQDTRVLILETPA